MHMVGRKKEESVRYMGVLNKSFWLSVIQR